MKIRFTETSLRALRVPEGKRDAQWFDDTLAGFGIRMFSSGKASFFIRYQIGAKQHKKTLGPYVPGILGEKKKEAAQLLVEARCNGGLQRKAVPEQKSFPPVGELINIYLEHRKSDLSPDWYKDLSSYFQKIWSKIYERNISELERGELVLILDEVAKQRGRTTADRARAGLSAFFSWAIDRGYVKHNPLLRLKSYAGKADRERVLTPVELVVVWQSLNTRYFDQIVRLLILTAQRCDEIGDLQWEEIDLEHDHAIHLPGARTKNRRAHRIPLNTAALSILRDDVPVIDGQSYVFSQGDRSFQGWSKAKLRLEISACRLLNPERMAALEARTGDLLSLVNCDKANKVVKACTGQSLKDHLHTIMPRWTLHDLRRTGATMMNDYDLAPPHIIEAILNHVSGDAKRDVAGIYNRAKYEAQKKRALDKWEQFLLSMLAVYEDQGFEGVRRFVKAKEDQLANEL